MRFRSILLAGFEAILGEPAQEAPPFFTDLNLDQIVEAITGGKAQYDLKPFFHRPLGSLEGIRYRHEVMQDLEREALFGKVIEFADRMQRMREELARSKKLYYRHQKQWWFLDAAAVYCDAVRTLLDDLGCVEFTSRGFCDLKTYLEEYTVSAGFTALMQEVQRLQANLAKIAYCLLIKYTSFTVRTYEREVNYSTEVEATFQKFAQGEGKNYRVKFLESIEMNHIEAAALEFVARLNAEVFADLDRFCTAHASYFDPTISRFDREIQFYISYLQYIRPLKEAGLPFCYPRLTATEKEISCRDGFDLALAQKLSAVHTPVICNDFFLDGKERILIISGPNQGGKTTFARMFGQLHYLANLGCPVPGREARLLLFDRMLTHFEREEKVENLRSKFEDDLVRIHDALEHATPRSILIMNESFSTTSLQDAVFIGREVMARVIARDLICVFVTFIDELTRLGETTVSMVSTIVSGDPTSRTFRIVRRPADGRAYAIAIAEKYRLTYELLKERIAA